MPQDMLDLESAKKELKTKSLLDIERATAKTWAARAAACYELATEAKSRDQRVKRLEEAMNYRQEALEHAAMTEDLPFIEEILLDLKDYAKNAEQVAITHQSS
jgi:hypothetical protein